MRTDPKARALETCLYQIRAGATIDQVIKRYPQWSSELRSLLEAACLAESLGRSIHLPEGFQTYSRAEFLQAAQELVHPTAHAPHARRSRSSCVRIFILLALIVIFGMGYLAQSTLPGDWLFPVKRSLDRAPLLFTRSTARRLDLEFQFDLKRLEEVQALAAQKRSVEVDFCGPLNQVTPGEWLVGTNRVYLPAQAQVVGQVNQGIYICVWGRLQIDGVVTASQVQAREYVIEGKLLQAQRDLWQVADVTVIFSPTTIVQGAPEIGQRVRVHSFRRVDGSLQARLIEVLSTE